MGLSVSQIQDLLHRIAPSRLAEAWDNIGLQIGSLDWIVNKIWVALDPLLHVVQKACSNKVDLLITHHPLFLKPLPRIDLKTTEGQIVGLALKKELSIFCVHTNFDIANDGITDILADKIGLGDLKVLKGTPRGSFYKLVIFAPLESRKGILKVLFSEGAGHIESYSCCSFSSKGTGTFMPGNESNPYVGSKGKLSEVREIKIESIVERSRVKSIIDSLRKIHPYESMAYDIYPILIDFETGIGRIGELEKSMTLGDLVEQIKSSLNMNVLKVSGNLESSIKSAAICSGSGSALMNDFIKSGAQVYISGEIGYHNALMAQDLGLATIELGHFYSEHLAMKVLADRLRKSLDNVNKDIVVNAPALESDVFKFV